MTSLAQFRHIPFRKIGMLRKITPGQNSSLTLIRHQSYTKSPGVYFRNKAAFEIGVVTPKWTHRRHHILTVEFANRRTPTSNTAFAFCHFRHRFTVSAREISWPSRVVHRLQHARSKSRSHRSRTLGYARSTHRRNEIAIFRTKMWKSVRGSTAKSRSCWTVLTRHWMRRTAGTKHIAQIPETQTKPEPSLSHETHCRGPGPRVSRLRNSRTCWTIFLSQPVHGCVVLPTAAVVSNCALPCRRCPVTKGFSRANPAQRQIEARCGHFTRNCTIRSKAGLYRSLVRAQTCERCSEKDALASLRGRTWT